MNMAIGSINKEKDMLIERYEQLLNFLKGVQLNNAEDLLHIKKPLDDLESNLKHIPNGPLFNDILPTEIKDYILSLSHPCDSRAFIAASVCQDWKGILENRFRDGKVITEGECEECQDNECVKPTDKLKASAIHKLDVHLVIWLPATQVDSKLITAALTSVSKFTVTKAYDYDYEEEPILSTDQLDHLFASIENGDKIMEEVNLIRLDLKCINQEILANCLVSKIKRLTLDQEYYDDRMLDVGKFLSKLLQGPTNITHLTLIDFSFYEDSEISREKRSALSTFIAGALVNVENVKLLGYTNVPMERLLEKLLIRHKMHLIMKTLIISFQKFPKKPSYNFGSLISPQDLRILYNKMATLQLEGDFTVEQQEAVSSVPDVQVSQFSDSQEILQCIKKRSTNMF